MGAEGGAEKPMTKGEREELKRLARERARVAKADTERRAADLKALFEMQMMDQYDFDTVENWEAATGATLGIAARAEAEIREAFRNLGIPEMMAPLIHVDWHSRGRFVVQHEQSDLRRAAHKRIEAATRTAKHEIDKRSLDVQTQLVAAGLTSSVAIEFLASMPTVEVLMPDDIVGEVLAARERPALGPGVDDEPF
jgi:hypothetical protein